MGWDLELYQSRNQQGNRFILYTLAAFEGVSLRIPLLQLRGMPLFYRNVFDEWKIVYKESYHKL